MSEKTIPIPGRLKNVAIGGHVAGSEDIDAGGGKTQKQVNDETNATLALHQSEISGLNSQNYVSVSSYSSLPATGSANTIYRVSSWDGNANSGEGAADVTKYTEYAWNGTAYIVVSVKTQIGEVFDISEYKAVGGTLAKFADLSAALDSGNNVPAGIRKGGMSVKFVQSSDNMYVQFRLMANQFSTTVSNWQGVDDEPIAGSENLVKSGGVVDALNNVTNAIYDNSILRGVQITDGGFVEPGNGQVVEDAGWCYTDYIAIIPNTDYGPIIFCAWYNENKTYISGVQDANRGIYTSPANARFARFSIEIGRKESWVISENGVIVDGWQKKIFTKNLIKKTTVTDGGFIEPGNGQVVENATYCYTDFIPITALKYYGKLNLAAWYDYNKTYIDGAAQSAEGVISQAPSNAAYLRASIYISKKDNWSITENGEDNTLEGEILKNKTRINELEQTTDISLVPNYTQSLQWYYGGGIDTTNGNIITGGAFATWYYIKDYIPIKPNTVYGNVSIGAFYDKYRNFIIGFQQAIGTVTSPANAAFVRFCFGHPESHKFWEGTAPDFDNISDIRKLIAEIPKNLDFHVGADYDYTTFSSAVAAAKNVTSGVPTIHVHSGIYDLISENQAAANQGQNLIVIEKSMKIVFDPDAKLTALFPSSYEYYTGCSPIHIIGNADVTFEEMNIECSNCLYCVHDESYGNYTYTHKFINCNMKYTTQHSDGTKQCIGGGLGRFCTIIIDGGVYESDTSSWDTQGENELVISYHNGVNNSDNKSVLYVKNLYLKHKGRMEFYHCGHTEIMTDVYVCNCSMGADVTIPEGSGQYYFVDNMQLFAWNNVVRNNS